MESFERINFFGEDVEDVFLVGRFYILVGGGVFLIYVFLVVVLGVYIILKYILYFL